MAKTLTIQQDDFKKGLQLLDDDLKADFGSARSMLNVLISDRGGIQNRPGTSLIGTYDSSGDISSGLFNFIKSYGSAERLIKGQGSLLKFYYDNDWHTLKTGFTIGEQFGFTTSLVNTDNEDYTYFCNRTEECQRWSGAIDKLNGALVGSETSLVVDSTVKEDIYEAGTASSSTTTTIDVANTPWSADMWINFYVVITSGAQSGKVAKITDNDNNTLTFDTISGLSGTPTFQIRQLAFPESGTLIYNGTAIAYTDIPSTTEFTVTSAHAAPDDTPVTLVPEIFIDAPKGNRLENLLGRVYVGNVRSGVSRDDADALQGSTQVGSVFVSNISNPTDYSFQATRVAGEGDIINIPYGGGPVTDISGQEEFVYLYKKNYIEAVKYSGDIDDFAIRTPLKTGIGSVNKVIKGRDDHYFMTLDDQYTSIGRVASKDILPQTQNIGHKIKRLLESYKHNEFDGIEYGNRILSTHKSSDDKTYNDVVLIYNKETKSFEGIWTLPSSGFSIYNDDIHYIESNGPNVWKMFTGKSDVQSSTVSFPVTSKWQSNFFNVLPLKANIQAINSVHIEGLISGNTTIEYSLYRDFNNDSAFSFSLSGNEDSFLLGKNFQAFLGSTPLAITPLGTIGEVQTDGRRRFSLMIYFPWIYAQSISSEIRSEGKEQDWELFRITYGLKESVATRRADIKQI